MFALSIIFTVLFALSFVVRIFVKGLIENKAIFNLAHVVTASLAILLFAGAGFTTVNPVNEGIVTTLGKIDEGSLKAGPHFILPWSRVTEVYLGQQQIASGKSEASSRDLQKVHASLAVNYVVVDPLKLYSVNPTQTYPDLIVRPAVFEVFKAVTARYSAEELITKRDEVSIQILEHLRIKLKPYFLTVQTVNLTDFGFSKEFDEAIERKVTATQNADTAKRNQEKTRYDAESDIIRAEARAKAIQIEAQAIAAQGGASYIQMKAIEKWNGQLPGYMTGGVQTPFIGIK